ncbi:2-succinyl-5-enolpyruvyl-6-hydroxy-3-cyclohexene-1-carboxylic-acid synthase [Exiguobacterium sp. s22]|uniref:2-succinyl-5-enolpyruvyl-6-hydroxy-3- cyclohexene-1-carboxylic-acid synthase n=1 Tax=Exiguobacterium sp. s22 TaxID=2751272 RepID=UPI001BE8864C|nr:2-succinyl-5-enolpyruvyl-6-hydroxy-3-cyclohexene-1-carboxylic-acid synthase [Exiguobacterium sp. s22]
MNKMLTEWVASMVNRLVESGVKDVVISPGSRSTPLAVAAYLHPHLRHHIIVDERSAAFFALGLTRSTDTVRPVALICTSGTAATNYYSAVTEAYISQLPLIVLTTDRPHELRNVGAPQTINQVRLYGEQVKMSLDLPVPEEVTLSFMQQTVTRFTSVAMQAPMGPVHLNVPFREPLLPDLEYLKQILKGEPITRERQRVRPTRADRDLFSERTHQKQLAFVVGPSTPSTWQEGIHAFATEHNIPIFADPLSDMRRFDDVLTNYDTWLASEHRADWLPDVFIRFGAAPVSKRFNQWMSSADQLVVEEPGSYRDPSSQATICYGDALDFLPLIESINAPHYIERLRLFEGIAESAKASLQGEAELTKRLLDTSIERLFVSNSMPIRDVDTTLSAGKPVHVLANRGANGIDGVISSALGSCYDTTQAALLIGDLAFYHDSNALQLLKHHPGKFSVVISNNNGGGIFSFLPQASVDAQLFEDLFGTPLDLNIRGFAETYGLTYRLIERPDDIQTAVEDGIHLIEFPSNREQNVITHREWTQSVCARLITENEA